MPEISAVDLRRLKALDGRLQKALDERKSLTAEHRKLRAATREHAQRVRALTKDAGAAEEKLKAVLEENAALAARLEDSTADMERLRTASAELRDELNSSQAKLELERKSGTAAQEEADSLREDRDRLAEGLALASSQLAGESIAPVLPPVEVSKLVDGLLTDLGSRLSGMTIRDGTLQLKVGFEKVGRQTGFVVPSSESPPEVRENLHEISLRFGHTVEPDR